MKKKIVIVFLLTAMIYIMALTAGNCEEYITPGSHLVFGTYEQDDDDSNGQEPILWNVIDVDVEHNRAFIISAYALDVQPYNTEPIFVTWETSDLRKWLNHDFIDTAFCPAEREMIELTAVENGQSQGNKKWTANGGNETEDRVYLLSYYEAMSLLDMDTSKCLPTQYASNKGAKNDPACYWWLRSPGSEQSSAAIMMDDGIIRSGAVNYDGQPHENLRFYMAIGVRPCLWINLPDGMHAFDSLYGLKKNDELTFGRYEQDNSSLDGLEPIEWVVLFANRTEGKVLLISKYLLDYQPFNQKECSTWEDSSVRQWLNAEFLNTAFTATEQQVILPSTEISKNNSIISLADYNHAQFESMVWLLSIEEAKHFFNNDLDRSCSPTNYAIAQGVYAAKYLEIYDEPTAWWMLRSNRYWSEENVDCVTSLGSFSNGNMTERIAIRPCIWVEAKAVYENKR